MDPGPGAAFTYLPAGSLWLFEGTRMVHVWWCHSHGSKFTKGGRQKACGSGVPLHLCLVAYIIPLEDK